MTRQVVLLSGGMDSTVALAQCSNPVAAVSVYYGQRHSTELDAAKAVAEHYGVEHIVLDLSSWGTKLKGSLTEADVPVPDGQYDSPTMAVTVVPNRNAVLLMAAVGIAESRDADEVVTAVHAGDHAVYADCTPEFIAAADATAQVATGGRVHVVAPFVEISKTEIARLGHQLRAPLDLTWSCYKGGERHCGTCGTCTERIEAFAEAGLIDPTKYESQPTPQLTQEQINLIVGSTVRSIVASIRQNCTLPSHLALSPGGDASVTAVAEWVENPPEWLKATWADEARKIAAQ